MTTGATMVAGLRGRAMRAPTGLVGSTKQFPERSCHMPAAVMRRAFLLDEASPHLYAPRARIILTTRYPDSRLIIIFRTPS